MIHAALIRFQKDDGTHTDVWDYQKDERDADVVELKARKYADRKCGRVDAYTGEYEIVRTKKFRTADEFKAEKQGYDSVEEMHEAKERHYQQKQRQGY